MAKSLKYILIVSLIAFSLHVPNSFAQTGSDKAKVGGPRKQMATIVFAALAGAVLGLSTLSFYGRPQDKLQNIAIGAAVGVFVGTGYTVYQATAKPKDFYGQEAETRFLELSSRTIAPSLNTPKLVYNWEF